MIFTSVPVQVEIDPVPERVSFEGGVPALGFGTSHLLRPGSYELVAELTGYATLRAPVEVTRERDQRFRYTLEPLPGRLEIVLPEPGTVRVDGRDAGPAPGIVELPAGRHAVTITTERYLEFTTEIDVVGRGELQRLAPDLTPAWAPVTVRSEPEGADIRVAEEPRGSTPLTLDLMAGSYRLELRHPGFKPWVSDVQVRANEPLTVGPVRLGVPDGRLAVRSKPAGASVTVGGVYRGRTPLEIEVRPDVAQVVRAMREGYAEAEREVRVASGGRSAVEFVLEPILGQVMVHAS